VTSENQVSFTGTDPDTPPRISITGAVSGDNLPQIEGEVMTRFAVIDAAELILDLCGTSYIDSRGITLCIRLFKACTAKKIKLKIETNSAIYHLLSTTNLTNILNIHQIGP